MNRKTCRVSQVASCPPPPSATFSSPSKFLEEGADDGPTGEEAAVLQQALASLQQAHQLQVESKIELERTVDNSRQQIRSLTALHSAEKQQGPAPAPPCTPHFAAALAHPSRLPRAHAQTTIGP